MEIGVRRCEKNYKSEQKNVFLAFCEENDRNRIEYVNEDEGGSKKHSCLLYVTKKKTP
jgi:hypothetical protein